MALKKPLKLLFVNNRSKFAKNIIAAIKKRKIPFETATVLRSTLKKIDVREFDCAIMSGGPDTNWKRKSRYNGEILEKFKNKPVLGICLGHEFIVEHYGGKIEKLEKKIQGFDQIKIFRKSGLSGDRKTLRAYKAHQNDTRYLPKTLTNFASSKLCKIEMVKHKKRQHFGVQFHPEKSGRDGDLIFDNFFKICGESK